jgi:hypothetical protein
MIVTTFDNLFFNQNFKQYPHLMLILLKEYLFFLKESKEFKQKFNLQFVTSFIIYHKIL